METIVTNTTAAPVAKLRIGSILLPLALAQFVASFAASNMNVAINDIANDLGTSVEGIQFTITVFTLTMAALMIPGSKLTDIWGRKKCFILGLWIYGVGAAIASLSQNLGGLIIGYSLLEGVGSALMIPPIYIITTSVYTELTTRAKAFGIVSAMAGVGSAAGPLIGGLITTAISWRASFLLQVLAVGAVLWLARSLAENATEDKKPAFDFFGALLSAAGLFFVVVGILQASAYGWFTASQDFVIGNTVILSQGSISPVWLFVGIGLALLAWFYFFSRSREQKGKEPLLSTKLFQNKISNLGLITQNIQWLILLGSSFVISIYFQVVEGYSAIETGLVLTPATVGILLSSSIAGRLSKKYPQTFLIRFGFIATLSGLGLLLLQDSIFSGFWAAAPGLFVMGFGVGVMLTSSVNVVQSSFSDKDQGEISGLSRSVSNLGSSLGVAIAGTVMVSALDVGKAGYAWALITLVVIGLIGLGAAFLLPSKIKSDQT
jgi:MFS family permease